MVLFASFPGIVDNMYHRPVRLARASWLAGLCVCRCFVTDHITTTPWLAKGHDITIQGRYIFALTYILPLHAIATSHQFHSRPNQHHCPRSSVSYLTGQQHFVRISPHLFKGREPNQPCSGTISFDTRPSFPYRRRDHRRTKRKE